MAPKDDSQLEPPTFPTIGEDAEPENPEQGGEQERGAEDVNARIARLEEQLEAKDEQIQRLDSRYQDTVDRLMATPPQQHQPDDGGQRQPSVEELMSDLPDPVENGEGFRKELGKRLGSRLDSIETRFDQTAAQQTAQQRREKAWQDFQAQNTDLAEFPAEVNYAVNQEAQRLQSRGISLDDALERDRDRLFERIASNARSYLERLGVDPQNQGGDDEDGEGQGGGSGKRKRRGNGAQRTQVPGGTPGGVTNAGGEKKPSGKSFVKSLLEQQQADGLI